jgi:hypothetical protein
MRDTKEREQIFQRQNHDHSFWLHDFASTVILVHLVHYCIFFFFLVFFATIHFLSLVYIFIPTLVSSYYCLRADGFRVPPAQSLASLRIQSYWTWSPILKVNYKCYSDASILTQENRLSLSVCLLIGEQHERVMKRTSSYPCDTKT